MSNQEASAERLTGFPLPGLRYDPEILVEMTERLSWLRALETPQLSSGDSGLEGIGAERTRLTVAMSRRRRVRNFMV